MSEAKRETAAELREARPNQSGWHVDVAKDWRQWRAWADRALAALEQAEAEVERQRRTVRNLHAELREENELAQENAELHTALASLCAALDAGRGRGE